MKPKARVSKVAKSKLPRLIKKVLHRSQETKTFVMTSGSVQYLPCTTSTMGWNGGKGPDFTAGAVAPFAAAEPWVPFIYDCSPVISQGVQGSARIGQNAEIMNAYLKIHLASSTVSNAGLQPWIVDMFIGYYVYNPNNVDADPSEATSIYDTTPWSHFLYTASSNNTQARDSGVAATFNAPVYEDAWKVHYRRRFKVGPPASNSTQYGNNDFQMAYDFNVSIKKMLPKKLKYVTNGAIAQNAKGPFVWFFIQAAQNLTTTTANGNQPSVQITEIIQYKDA